MLERFHSASIGLALLGFGLMFGAVMVWASVAIYALGILAVVAGLIVYVSAELNCPQAVFPAVPLQSANGGASVALLRPTTSEEPVHPSPRAASPDHLHPFSI